MKDPATRNAPTTRHTQSWHAGNGGRLNQRHQTQPKHKNRRQKHQLQRLLALCGVIAGAYWLFLHATGAVSATSSLVAHVLNASPAVTSPIPATAVTGHAATSPGRLPTKGVTVAASARINQVATSLKPVKRTVPTATVPVLRALPASVLLQSDYQVYETWNNCGPASLSMALSYFGIHESQAALGQDLRPYQNSQGDNDDKNVSLDELVQEAKKFGLLAYHRPNGSMQLLKQFVANGLPVIIDTNMTTSDDIGHYRVVKGYDDTSGVIIQDDSMQGHNVRFSYADMNDDVE